MKTEPATENQIETAINDVKNAMIENMEAGRAEVQAKDRKRKAHYQLQKANERLRGIQSDMYAVSLN